MKLAASGEHDWRIRFSVCPEIWLDGVQLHSVIEADAEAGYVIQPKFGSRGELSHLDGEVITVRREGKVSFIGGKQRAEVAR